MLVESGVKKISPGAAVPSGKSSKREENKPLKLSSRDTWPLPPRPGDVNNVRHTIEGKIDNTSFSCVTPQVVLIKLP